MAAMATFAKPLGGTTVAGATAAIGSTLPGRAPAQLRVSIIRRVNGARRFRVRASDSDGLGSVADAGGNSVVLEVAALPEEPDTEGIGNAALKARKPSPLQKGGTLDDERKEGKAPAAATLGKVSPLAESSGAFDDPRWKNGTWDLAMFTKDGKTNWDAVIDAGMLSHGLSQNLHHSPRYALPLNFEREFQTSRFSSYCTFRVIVLVSTFYVCYRTLNVGKCK